MTALLRRAAGWLLLALALCFWAGSCLFAGRAAEQGGRAVFRLDGAPADAAAAKAMLAAEARTDEPRGFVLWRQADGETVKSPELGREETVSVLAAWGETSLLVPARPALAPGTGRGCLLDAATARALFGDERAAGQTARWRDQNYTVLGVFDAPAGTMLVEEDPSGPAALNRLTLDVSGSENPRGLAEAFAMRHALPGSGAVQYGGTAALARIFSRLPALAAAFSLLWMLLRRAHARRDYPVQRLLFWLAAAVALLGALWLAGIRPAPPQEMIPTRWSDFSFWETLLQERRAEWAELLWMKKERPDILLFTAMGKAAACGLAALLIFAHGARRIASGPSRAWLGTLAACLAGSFAAVVLAGGGEIPAGDLPMLWLLCPLWLAVRRAAEIFPLDTGRAP